MSNLRAVFEAAKAAKLNGSANSRTAHAKLARAGALKLTVSAGTVPAAPTKGRRREPSMPQGVDARQPTYVRAHGQGAGRDDARCHRHQGAQCAQSA